MHNTYFTLIFLTISLSLSAANIDWLGGTGDWDDPLNWSTGTIPTLADEVDLGSNNIVKIPQGYMAYAQSVRVGTGSTFKIKLNATLNIETNGTYGLRNHGETIVIGNLLIMGDKTLSLGVENYGTLSSKQGSLLKIATIKSGVKNFGVVQNAGQWIISDADEDFSTSGINHASGSFTNYAQGIITLHDLANRGIYLGTTNFVNYGRIHFLHNIDGQELYNSHPFFNYGEVIVEEFSGVSIYNENEIQNYGTFSFSGGLSNGIAIQNWYANFNNRSTGEIFIENSDDAIGIYQVGIGHQFTNRGLIDIDKNDGSGIVVSGGSFYNKPAGEITISGDLNNSSALFVDSDGLIENEGGKISIEISSGNGISCILGGSMLNNDCGTVTTSERIRVEVNSSFQNDAWLNIEPVSLPHTNAGAFDNYGVINDPSNSLDGMGVNNYGIIVRPLPGPVAQNVPTNNALLVGSLAGSITVATNWKKGAGGASLGTYDRVANTFTPSTGSEGNDQAYILFDIAGCNPMVGFDIDIPGGILPLRVNPTLDGLVTDEIPNQMMSVFPNPAEEEIHLVLPKPLQGKVQITIQDLTGRTVLNTTEAIDGRQLDLSRPAALPNGTYLLQLLDQSGEKYLSKLILI